MEAISPHNGDQVWLMIWPSLRLKVYLSWLACHWVWLLLGCGQTTLSEGRLLPSEHITICWHELLSRYQYSIWAGATRVDTKFLSCVLVSSSMWEVNLQSDYWSRHGFDHINKVRSRKVEVTPVANMSIIDSMMLSRQFSSPQLPLSWILLGSFLKGGGGLFSPLLCESGSMDCLLGSLFGLPMKLSWRSSPMMYQGSVINILRMDS